MDLGTERKRSREPICHQGAVWAVGTSRWVRHGLALIPLGWGLADAGSFRRHRCCRKPGKNGVQYLMHHGIEEWMCWKNGEQSRLSWNVLWFWSWRFSGFLGLHFDNHSFTNSLSHLTKWAIFLKSSPCLNFSSCPKNQFYSRFSEPRPIRDLCLAFGCSVSSVSLNLEQFPTLSPSWRWPLKPVVL